MISVVFYTINKNHFSHEKIGQPKQNLSYAICSSMFRQKKTALLQAVTSTLYTSTIVPTTLPRGRGLAFVIICFQIMDIAVTISF